MGSRILLEQEGKKGTNQLQAGKLQNNSSEIQRKTINIAVIQVYAPTTGNTDEELEVFYEQLEATLGELGKKEVKLIIGDWNAKVGKVNKGCETVMCRYGYGS